MEQRTKERSLRQRIGLALGQPVTVAALVEAEQEGIEQVWAGQGGPSNPDVLTTLTAATARTTRLHMGTAIIQAASRHPAFLAQQALALNNVAPGRIRLGLGTGFPARDRPVYGEQGNTPLAYLREYLQVLYPLMRQGAVHHHGQVFTVDAELSAPVSIPILTSALGPRSFRLAGELADGAITWMCPISYLVNTALPELEKGAVQAGRRRPPVVAHVPVLLASDRSVALAAGRRALTFYTRSPYYRHMFSSAGFSTQEIEGLADSLVEKVFVYGDGARIKERLQEILALGIDELVVSPSEIADSVQERVHLIRLIGQL
jgi:alkanesulfonate monooxygenase SsuD/methylene tetrahydromethanopterin reductase-like flavin-dependent oxidoreductase (luciferase family)